MSFEFQGYTQLYTKTLAAIEAGWSLIVHEGGTSSSKTWSILQALFTLALHDPGSIITVIGQDIPNIKKGVLRDARAILQQEPQLREAFHPLQKTDRIYESKQGGSIIEFNSYDDEQDAKSGKRDYAFFNEANGIPYPIYDAINVRTSKVTLIDFNPTAPFWAHEKILPDTENRKWFVSNFQHNPYLDDQVRQKILSYEPTEENIARGTANQYRWDVYGLGKLGKLEGLVFPDFAVVTDWPQDYKWRVFGLDFGFTNAPSALIEIRYAHGNLYWQQRIYEVGLTNTSENEARQPSIDGRLQQINFPTNQAIIADSAEPKSIQELRQAGWNVKAAEKGQGSVSQGLDMLQRYPHKVHAQSRDLIEEFSSYTWKEDRDGNPTNAPIDDYNHGIDAGRYALVKKLGVSTKVTRQPRIIMT